MALIRFLRVIAIGIVLCANTCMPDTALAAPIPDDPKLFSGNPVGLTDLEGRDIVPPLYSNIKYVGNGIFLMTGIDPKDRYHSSDDKHVFTREGVELKFSVPSGAQFEEIFWLGDESNKDDDIELKDLPEDTLLLYREGDKQGLCRKTGEVFLPPGHHGLLTPNEGLALRREFIPLAKKRPYSILDLKTGQVTPLSIDAWRIRSLPFCEGIATFHPENDWRVAGFIKKTGKVEMYQKYSNAQSFCKGYCSVCLNAPNNEQNTRWVIIDKSYSVVSPPELNVQDFHGDLAVAWERSLRPPKFGLVDRNFHFVIEPQFGRLEPVFDGSYFSDFWYQQKERKKAPEFYFASLYGSDDKLGNNKIAVSTQGKVLFKFPPSITTVPPQVVHGCIRYHISYPANGENRSIYLDMEGHEVPDPRKLPVATGATFTEIAPGRLAKVVNNETGRFDPLFWAKHCFPGGRFEMFRRFLKEYNLIGMSRHEVLSLLSADSFVQQDLVNGDRLVYAISEPSSCGARDAVILKVFFKNDRVSQWCFGSGGVDSAPYTQNVVFPDSFRGVAYGALEPDHMELKK